MSVKVQVIFHSTLTGSDGARQPSENGLKIARYQGKHVAKIAGRLFR